MKDQPRFSIPKNITVVRIPEVVVFKEINFGGESFRTNCDVDYVGNHWNDDISSIIVVEGTWEFYKDANFKFDNKLGSPLVTLTPGYYPNLIKSGKNSTDINDKISSFKCVSI